MSGSQPSPVTPPYFRLNFPAFAGTAQYPNEQIQLWLNDAYANMDPNRWGPSLDLYAQLRTAHFLVIESMATNASQRGAVPGQATGIVSSKSVGPASVSYDTGNAVMQGADTWNQTTYGQRYWRKARMAGAGGMQFL